ncbi:tetratricopeptide repeat protein [Endothiovibrio diazotrophicus]
MSNHYNPDWLDDDDLEANFVARRDEFEFLRGELIRAPRQGSVQHHLLVGLRGAGKTTLLKRLAVALRRDPQLNDHLLPLSFPEELYQVKNLADFWWATCEALADELDRRGETQRGDRLMDRVEQARAAAGDDPTDTGGLERLLQGCDELERRPVLLVDNLDLIFQRIEKSGRKRKNPDSPVYWALREALSTTRSPIVIGGSARLSEPFTDYDKAFYDFFLPKRLGKLSLEEARSVIEHLAEVRDAPQVKRRLSERPGRIEALYELTGGNPRALGLIFELLRQGAGSRAVEDFHNLMDLTTPYYKARFEDLADQAQVVMHALAVCRPGADAGSALRFGHSAAAIAAHTHLTTGTVSTQMNVLEREGLVEKSSAHGRTQYRIAEQLFRLWLQMRGTRRIRQNVIGLTEFLEAMFDLEELKAHLGDAGASPLNDARYFEAVSDTAGAAPMRRALKAHGADRVLHHLRAGGGEIGEYLAPGDLPEDLERHFRLCDRLQRSACGELMEEERNALLGSLELREEEKERWVEALCDPDEAEGARERLRARLGEERDRLLHRGLLEEDLPLLYALRARGQLPLPVLTTDDVEAVCAVDESPHLRLMVWRLLGTRDKVRFPGDEIAQAWIEWGREYAADATATEWANVVGAMRRSKRYAAAERLLSLAMEKGESSRGWYERATLLSEKENDFDAAEKAYRIAIEFDPNDAFPWNGLGLLLAGNLDRPDEAETAYRKAIEIEPADAPPWNNLGLLLAAKLDRLEEAETAFRKAIEIEPADALPWNNLGFLLAEKLDRPEEAETAFRKAIEIDPTFAWSWNALGVLLAEKLDCLDEAESAYRKAIEIDPTFTWPWNNLGALLEEKLDRPDEAESAYRTAIEIDSTLAWSWNNLGDLLADKLDRPDEAETAYRKAIEIDPAYARPWNNLGDLLADKLDRPDEAESAYRKAIEIDPKYALPRYNLGRLLERQERWEEALEAYARGAELEEEPHPFWLQRRSDVETRLRVSAALDALSANDPEGLRAALGKLLQAHPDPATALVSDPFVEGFLAPLIGARDQGAVTLAALRELGFDKPARPLLLAFEAALARRPEMLEELEPEVRTAAQRMFARLSAD